MSAKDCVKLAEVMSGESGAERVKKYSMPMAAGMTFNYAAKEVNDEVLEKLYSQALSRFPAHLQQADMESNGKSVNRFGECVNRNNSGTDRCQPLFF